MNTAERQKDINKDKYILERMKNEELTKKLNKANKEINMMQKENRTNNIKHRNEVNKIEQEQKRLQNKYRKDCEQYVSRDTNTVAIIQKYKENDERYRNTISKLEDSNSEMVKEILDLREKIADLNLIVYGKTE